MTNNVLESLARLVDKAARFGSTACAAGEHDWVSQGGRCCPKDLTDLCSQAVYVCRSCEAQDYGDPGGPGHHDCRDQCKFKYFHLSTL
jgi:hypothetical protein